MDLATQKELMRLDVDIIPFPTKEHGNEAICTAVAEGKNGQVFFFNALKLIPSVPKLAALPSCGASLKTSFRQVIAKSSNPHDKINDSSSSSRRAPAIHPVHKSILRLALSGTFFWTKISAICNRPPGLSTR